VSHTPNFQPKQVPDSGYPVIDEADYPDNARKTYQAARRANWRSTAST
jgi:hypothetical protein